ncbi:MAG TPA: GTPase HflX [Candidatus Acidoferrales bacterium]|nr:GTPase HflX [Candidatus Acidoferrales bacterium]
MKTPQPVGSTERVLLVGVGLKRGPRLPGLAASDYERERLEELHELARSAGAQVAGSVVQMREDLDPASLVGRGKLDEIRAEALSHRAGVVIFDRNLSPGQQRNIEKSLDCRVLDRTQLILDIFARHARTREGMLQVELAQLNYLLPRLAGRGVELSRLGGGIGTRGPGEQKLETDRRRIRSRISKIRDEIELVRRRRRVQRSARRDIPLPSAALVGYTNAGKSTLFNALTRADVLTSPRMFATLDPTVRAVELPSGRRVLLSDTVGFIRDLPHGLIAAFRATLEEAQEAALILHVTDISSPNHPEQDAEVVKILDELGLAGRPRIHVLNKCDRLSEDQLASLSSAQGVCASALRGDGLRDLLQRIEAALPFEGLVRMQIELPLEDGRTLACLHARGRVFASEVRDSHLWVDAEVPVSLAGQLKPAGARPQRRGS